MSGYWQVTVVVEGALDIEAELDTEAEVDALRILYAFAAAETQSHVQFYTLYHDHKRLEPDEECCCAQYATSHKPEVEFNAAFVDPEV